MILYGFGLVASLRWKVAAHQSVFKRMCLEAAKSPPHLTGNRPIASQVLLNKAVRLLPYGDAYLSEWTCLG